MAGRTRMQVGSGPWIAEERTSASQIAQTEVEEFTFSVQNDFDWLNEHMAEVFSENQINVAEIFKTPGKLRGKTPRTVRKGNLENRVPLSNIFSSTPKDGPNPFVLPHTGRPNTPRVKIAVDPQPSPPKAVTAGSPRKQNAVSKHASPAKPPAKPVSVVDSGYHGSQSQDAMQIDDPVDLDDTTQPFSLRDDIQHDNRAIEASPTGKDLSSPVHPSYPTKEGLDDASTDYFTAHAGTAASPCKPAHHDTTTPAGSPAPPPFSDADKSPTPAFVSDSAKPQDVEPDVMESALDEISRSPSDGSSPIRPIVRKSSLNFASLPAREPITHKSIGNRTSRTSHLDQNRTSQYRNTGGKSLGGYANQDVTDDENDDMDIDDFPPPPKPQPQVEVENAALHNKTYTQRLQDQINQLGKPQANVQQTSKRMTGSTTPQQSPSANLNKPLPSQMKTTTTPGAFPEDDDDWIEPLGTPDDASNFKSPRPGLPKSHTADIMEQVSGKNTISGDDFAMPSARPQTAYTPSPLKSSVPERNTGVLGHHKSVSVPVLPVLDPGHVDGNRLEKTISAATLPLATVAEDGQPQVLQSPSRGFSNSPLKQVKNKLSSILKSSRGLLASSAAISAEGKSSLLSPSTTRLGIHLGLSTESLRPASKGAQSLYPDLSRQVADTNMLTNPASPERAEGRRTRASIEREKNEEKRKKEEAKEARRLAEQTEKLEKAREKEREKARVFSKEQERVASLEKQATAQKEQEKRAAIATPGNIPRSIRSSPQKVKTHAAPDEQDTEAFRVEEDTVEIEMVDAPSMMPPPSVPRPTAPSSAMKTKEIKRPVRPTKEPASKVKQAPTVIRVNMGSQHSQYQPNTSALSSSLHDTLSQPQLKGKNGQSSMQPKPSLQSLKSSTSSLGRPKALEAAARRKEQEERETQRRRDAKAELDRKRAAVQEEERRQEQQRKLEAERQKEEERKLANAQAEAKNAHRQAMLEKAKQTRAPPPAVRGQPGGPPEYGRNEAGPSRPPSRVGSMAPRAQDDNSRPVNTILSTASKAQTKRPLPQEAKDSKRMRMTDEFDEPVGNEKQPSLKGAPVRPSGGVKKDLPTKSMFSNGYTNAPPQSVTRDLFKATVTNQHHSHIKATHPLDMAQMSKGAIPFAPNSHAAGGPSKTPARPAGKAVAKSAVKSATRSSPRFQNGDSIELPEINTDDEDEEDEDDGKGLVADWADSPNLRRALVEQEDKNPFEVFGAPAPLNMEEVFARSKERFPKFRNRTSSANWSGPDGLTEEDIRKDLAARERMRRDGGWSYDMGREMI
ncbi:hypothetical protein F4808DRAFT_316588 [Astrocystis sublimbata]|nr:hypothetical protein F4808DRAFT_316588 [Astrocystis sublimbata]